MEGALCVTAAYASHHDYSEPDKRGAIPQRGPFSRLEPYHTAAQAWRYETCVLTDRCPVNPCHSNSSPIIQPSLYRSGACMVDLWRLDVEVHSGGSSISRTVDMADRVYILRTPLPSFITPSLDSIVLYTWVQTHLTSLHCDFAFSAA